MGRMNFIYEEGDTVFYPELTQANGKTMKVLGSRIYHYPSGIYVQYFFKGHTPEGDGLTDRLVENMRDNVDNAYDNLVVITGREGSGKSNLAVEICKLYDPTFNLEERYIYDYYPFLEKLEKDFNNRTQGKAYLMDEATNLASNRDWNKDDNKSFIQLLEMFRSRGLSLILCIPSFDRLDVYIREHRARFVLECLDLPEGERFKGRGYYRLKICATNRMVGVGTFSKMSPEDKEIYEGLKEKSQFAKLQEMKERAKPTEGGGRIKEANDRNKRMLWWFIDREGWSYAEVSQRFDIPEGTLRRWMKELKDDE